MGGLVGIYLRARASSRCTRPARSPRRPRTSSPASRSAAAESRTRGGHHRRDGERRPEPELRLALRRARPALPVQRDERVRALDRRRSAVLSSECRAGVPSSRGDALPLGRERPIRSDRLSRTGSFHANAARASPGNETGDLPGRCRPRLTFSLARRSSISPPPPRAAGLRALDAAVLGDRSIFTPRRREGNLLERPWSRPRRWSPSRVILDPLHACRAVRSIEA